jgi:hypothetical protein
VPNQVFSDGVIECEQVGLSEPRTTTQRLHHQESSQQCLNLLDILEFKYWALD